MASTSHGGDPTQFIHLLQTLYTEAVYVVSINGVHSETISHNIGTPTRLCIVPDVVQYYNIYKPALELLQSWCTQEGLGFTFTNIPCACADYADDIQGLLQEVSQPPDSCVWHN
jgi:hypothetical protein